MWDLKYNTNEPIQKRETYSQTYRTGSWLPRRMRGCGGGMDGDFGINRCKRLYYTQNDKQQGPTIYTGNY